jgi:predicted nucleic acid-binding protein
VPFVYFDASALVKLFLDEDGSDLAIRLWSEADELAVSTLARVEVRAALAAAARDGRLETPDYHDARRRFERYWNEVAGVAPGPVLLEQACKLAEQASLRALDAVHLASALAVGPALTIFTSWDERLRAAAAAEGLGIAPAH